MDPRLFQQQSPQQQFYLGAQSSPIPGAAGGRGDPGPSSMAQQQMHQQLQQQLQQQLMQSQQQQQAQGQQGQQPQQPRLPFNPATLQPQQLAMLQRLAQSSPGNQINQQQVQMALAGLQAAQAQGQQGGLPAGMSPQMLAAAMRPGQFAGQLNPQQQQQLAQHLFANQLNMQGGAPGGMNQAQATQQAMQQQRLQHLMQAQATQQQIQQQIQQQQQQQAAQQSPQLASAGTPTQQHAGAGVMTPEMARIHMQQQQGRQSPSVGSPVRPNMPHPGSMAPPAIPPGASPRATNMTPQQSPARPPGTFSLTPQQQQLLATQRQQLLSHPQFKALPSTQQQQQLGQMQQKMVHVFLLQNQQQQQQQAQMGQQQPPQQPQTQQHQSPVHFSPSAQHPQPGTQMPPQQPPTPTPRPPTPQAHQSPVPASSLPQHMVPNRPASAASQHAPSPHQSLGPGSPALRNTPPSTTQATFGTPQPPPSPAHSNHSHHSHVTQTPKPQPTPSPIPPQDAAGPPQISGINGQLPGQHPFAQNPQAVQAIQALQQHAQNAQSFMHGPGGQPPNAPPQQGFPPGALPPGIPPGALQNMSPQQMAQAMNYFQQQQAAAAAQAQAGVPVRPGMPMPPGVGGPGGIRPPTQQMRIPPLPPGINPAEFPFDARLIPFLQQINNPQWREEMAQRNPGVLAEVQQIAHRIQTGQIRPEILQRMQQFVMHMQRMTQQRMGQMPGAPGQPPQPGMSPQRPLAPPPGMPGYPGAPPGMQHPQQPSPQQETPPPNAMAPGHQQRMWPGGQMAGSPAPPNVRPPPGHAAGAPDSPAPGSLLARRTSSTTKPEKQPRDAAMPPPAFIPAHGAPPVRPPAEAQQAPPPQQSTSGLPVKEWEGALRLDVPTTAINPLPIDEFDEREDPTFGGKLPPMTDLEKNEVKTWLAKDIKFATGIIDQRKKTHLRMQAWSEVEERQTQWWMMRKGEARPRVPKHVNIIYPADKALQRLKARKRKEIRFTPKQYKSMAEIEDHIVPVRLELEHEHNRFSDTFLWNCSDTVVTPELFAQSICDDFKLPAGQFVPKIVAAIKERVREYQDQVMPLQSDKKPELSGRGVIDEDDPETCTMMELFRQAHEADEMDEIRTDEGADQDDSHIRIVSFDDEVLDDKVMTVDEAMACLAPPAENDELRILIKIDIIVGTQNLVDTFEWDLNSKVTAEEFAQSYCIDLGLCGEFVTAIAHDIHEQVVTHQRSLFIVGHTQNSGYINNDDLRSAFLPPLTVALRKEDVAMATFTPVLATFTEQDVIAIEKERERESKRKKRGTRGRRGIVLPDREPPKTFRTQLHPLIDPAVIAAADPAPPPMSSTRRAAAIAAQANINLALNETQPFLAPSPPPAATHTGRGRGRWPRGGRGGGMSRASPSSTREGSVVNGDHTPTIGFKRSLREDSEPGLASPLPPRKRHNGRIADSPEADEQLDKRPDDTLGAPVPPVAPVRAPSPPKQWHCKNCGVPEHLSGGKREMDLCAKCSDYLQRTGQRRPAQYNEDEEYHRLRNDSDSPKPPAFEMPITPVVASPSRKRVSNRFDEDSDSDSSSSSDEDEDDEHMRKKAKTAAAKPGASPSLGAPVTPKVTSSSALPVTPQPHNAPTPPDWTSRAHAIMQAKYPDHRFGIVLKSRPADAASGTPNEWRVKCHDCPGRLYNPGPDETLNNFEVHLKNRQHRERVEARVAAKRK